MPNLVSVTTAGRGCEQFWALGAPLLGIWDEHDP